MPLSRNERDSSDGRRPWPSPPLGTIPARSIDDERRLRMFWNRDTGGLDPREVDAVGPEGTLNWAELDDGGELTTGQVVKVGPMSPMTGLVSVPPFGDESPPVETCSTSSWLDRLPLKMFVNMRGRLEDRSDEPWLVPEEEVRREADEF